jgi:hypothetical protein
MKLSESILLGSTLVKPKAGALHFSGENAGCALGMAVIANGWRFVPARREVATSERRTLNVEDIWGTWLLQSIGRPCDCRAPLRRNGLQLRDIVAYIRHPRSFALPREMRIKDIIAHLFDHHVMQERDWTLIRITTWLQPLEPSEPAQVVPVRREAMPRGNLLAEAAEWQRALRAFEAHVMARRPRFPRYSA